MGHKGEEKLIRSRGGQGQEARAVPCRSGFLGLGTRSGLRWMKGKGKWKSGGGGAEARRAEMLGRTLVCARAALPEARTQEPQVFRLGTGCPGSLVSHRKGGVTEREVKVWVSMGLEQGRSQVVPELQRQTVRR